MIFVFVCWRSILALTQILFLFVSIIKRPYFFFSDFHPGEQSNKAQEVYYDNLRNVHVQAEDYDKYKSMILYNFQKSRQYEKLYTRRDDQIYEM